MLRAVVTAAGIGLAFAIDNGIFGVVILLFVLVVPFEKLYPRQRAQKLRRPLVGTDIAFALMGPVLNIVGVAAIVTLAGLSLFWLPGLALRPLVSLIPAVALPFVAFVIFDFVAYWGHRWAHEVPMLWRFHAVHHSPEHMDWISGFRIHPFDGVVLAPAIALLLGAGIDAEITGVIAIIQIALGLFFHANVRLRLRLLDRIVANPEFHHWHHANETDAIGHNYAGALPIWDLIFGTYFMPRTERRPAHYGVDGYPPRTMWSLLTYPLAGARQHVSLLWHPIRGARFAWRGLRRLLAAVRQSTFRPTHSARRELVAGCSSSNLPIIGDAAIGRLPVRRF